MGGLARICKALGAIRIQGKLYKWDYAEDRAVPAHILRDGTERWKASEKARAEYLKERLNDIGGCSKASHSGDGGEG
jgi:hypothetical protein